MDYKDNITYQNIGIAFADGRINTNSASYKNGYNTGIIDADNRANTNSINYKEGYTAGYNEGIALTKVNSGSIYVTAVEWNNVELGYKPTYFTFMLIDENGNEYSLATITPDIQRIDQRYVQLTDTGFTWNVGQYGFLRSTVYWAASNK